MHKLTCLFSLIVVSLVGSRAGKAASWTELANLAPSVSGTIPPGAGTMLLLTDGTVMVLANDRQHWMRLTPDPLHGYQQGTWSVLSPMSTPRLYFASQVLPSGKVWVFGGEYTEPGLPKNWGSTGEIYDPIANSWSPIAPFPNQAACFSVTEFSAAVSPGSDVVTNLGSTTGWMVGWTVTGPHIQLGTTITSIDSSSQIHLSNPVTTSVTSPEGTYITVGPQSSGNITAESAIVTNLDSTFGYQKGWSISGQGILSNTTVVNVISPTSIQISRNANETISGDALNFSFFVQPPSCFGDNPSILLPGGKVLAGDITSTSTYIYDPTIDTWTPTGSKAYNDTSSEEGWAKLANGKILTYDIAQSIRSGSGYAELYDPIAGTWSGISPSDDSATGFLPLLTSSLIGDELGPLLRLYDDRIFVIGANGQTALYTPMTDSWVAGPDIFGALGNPSLPFLFAADDAAAAILPNGHVILAADAGNGVRTTGTTATSSTVVTGIPSTAQLQEGWSVAGIGLRANTKIYSVDSPTQVTLTIPVFAGAAGTALTFGGTFATPAQLFDFDPVANTITQIPFLALPDSNLTTSSATTTRMLMLPTGQLLFSDGTTQLWIYTPDGGANPSLQPVITEITSQGGGNFTLQGTQINGQSAGSAYGDDVQSDENYPIISFQNSSGSVYYARTTNWSYSGVAGGNTPQTVDFALNGMPPGTYLMTLSAAGIASAPVTVTVSSDLSQITLATTISSVLDAESGNPLLTPGEWAAIYGLHLADSTRPWNAGDFNGGLTPPNPLPTTLDGVSVAVNGQPAAVYYITPTQIDFQVPDVSIGAASVVVTNNGMPSTAFQTTIVPSSPSFYYYAVGSDLFAAAVHTDGTLVGDPVILGSGVERAHPGETIELYCNGITQSPAGVVVGPTVITTPLTISAAGTPLVVVGEALVSAGQFQVNVTIPNSIPMGTYPLSIQVGKTSGPSGIAVMLPVGP